MRNLKLKRARPPRGRQRGASYVEVLVAGAVLSTCLAAMSSQWYFSYNMTQKTIDKAMAYNLGRQQVETVKQTGFDNTAEAPTASPTINYYDGSLVNKNSAPALARYKVETTVVSDLVITGSNPTKPAEDALRTVTVKVYSKQTNELLFSAGTYLVKKGI